MLCGLFGIIFFSYFESVPGQCDFPSQFQNSVWLDSDKGELQFTVNTMTGWELTKTNLNGLDSSVIEADWECFHTESDTDSTYIMLKMTSAITLFDATYDIYLCMQLMKISAFSYYYYLLWEQQGNVNQERITAKTSGTSITDPKDDLCISTSQTQFYPSENEYHILLKQGNEADAKQDCPTTFYGQYNYFVNDTSGSVTCDPDRGDWDVCTDYQRMTFNYTSCNTKIASSANGSVACVFSMTSGSNTLVTVYNEDASVVAGYERFTCFKSSISSDGSLELSQSPGSCTKDQIPTSVPSLANGTGVGLQMRLTPKAIVPETSTNAGVSTSVSESPIQSGLSNGAIAGIILALAALGAFIIFLICFYMKFRSKKSEKEKSRNENSSSVNARSIICCQWKNKSMDAEKTESPIRSARQANYDSARALSDITEENFETENGKYHSNISSPIPDVTIDTGHSTTYESVNVEKSNDGPNEFTDIQNADVSISGNESTKTEMEGVSKDDNIEVTRIVETKSELRRDIKLMNSTENLFTEYDAAMSYKSPIRNINRYDSSSSQSFIKKRGIGINVNVVKPMGDDNISLKSNKSTKSTRSSVSIKSTRSAKSIKSLGELNAQRTTSSKRPHKSENDIFESGRKESARSGSFKSSLKSNTFSSCTIEWNFDYMSPYAMSEQQKIAMMKRKLNLQRKRRRTERKKQNEKEKRERENTEAFEKWLQRKKERSSLSKNKMHRFTSWYP